VSSGGVGLATIGTPNLQDAAITASKIGIGAVVAAAIQAAAVDTTKLNTKQIILTGDVWTDNSPAGGSVAWNAHSLIYGGTVYSIVAANSGANKYIVWRPGISTTSYQLYTQAAFDALILADNDFTIAVNNSGVHDIAWYSRTARQFIGSAFIADLAVLTAKIADLAVSTAKIASLAVTNAKISDVQADKITTGLLAVLVGLGATGSPSIVLDGANRLITIFDPAGVGRVRIGKVA
jgi:hypothetical protein